MKLFSLLNEMLQQVGKKDKDYKFNPKYIFNDEAGSNLLASVESLVNSLQQREL